MSDYCSTLIYLSIKYNPLMEYRKLKEFALLHIRPVSFLPSSLKRVAARYFLSYTKLVVIIITTTAYCST